MAQINITNLSFNYDGSADSVFENVNLCLDTDWRLGLIGRNGRGKTTLLKLLCGIYEYSGKITTNVEFEYYPYNVKNTRDIVYNIICEICTAQQWEMERELSLLELRNDILWREFDTLSNGERTKDVYKRQILLHSGSKCYRRGKIKWITTQKTPSQVFLQ